MGTPPLLAQRVGRGGTPPLQKTKKISKIGIRSALSFLVLIGHWWRERGAWMFTRRGRYVVRKLPARTEVGSATTLLDAADVAMEDARRGPGKYVIEQPPIEVDVSKAYGVLAAASTPPSAPEGLTVTSVGETEASAECQAVVGASQYQWYLSGVPYLVTSDSVVLLSGLTAGTAYTVQVAAIAGGLMSAATEAVGFTTSESEAPVWQAVPAQYLTVGVYYELDLAAYVQAAAGVAKVFSLVSGALAAGVSIVGTKLTGVPTAVETVAPVLRVTVAGQSADSAAVTLESLNADVTAPAAPTNFAATPYSLTQVRLTWTNPAGDAVVAGERASGFQGVDVYRDGAKIDRVLATAADPESYLATWNAVALWKVRSVDFVTPNPNKGAFTAELSAGPLVATANPPQNVAATRTGSTTATVSWAAGDGPAPSGYRVYMALALNGTYSLKASPSSSPLSVTSGFTGSQTPYFYVTAMIAGVETVASAIVSADSGTLGTLYDLGFDEGASINANGVISLRGALTANRESTANAKGQPTQTGWYQWGWNTDFNTFDAFDQTSGDVLCKQVASPVRYDPGSGTGRAMRMRMTFHTGADSFPQTNDKFLPAAAWHRKGGWNAGDPGTPGERAHRNEVHLPGGTLPVPLNKDLWFGFSLLIPIAGNPWGDTPMTANSFMAGWRHVLQLHPETGGRNPVFFISLNGGWRQLTTVVHPTSAPRVIGYGRGSDAYAGLSVPPATSGADDLRVEWLAPTSGPAVSAYRIFRSVRTQGPFVQIGADIPASGNSAQSGVNVRTGEPNAAMGGLTYQGAFRVYYTESNLGQSTWGDRWTSAYVYACPVYAGGSLGPASLISPSPRDYLAIGGRNYLQLPSVNDSGSNFYQSIPGCRLADIGNQWLDFVVNMKMVPTGAGYLQVWMNGAEIFYNGSLSIGEPIDGHYWRAGIYHGLLYGDAASENVPPDWPKRVTTYFDEFKQTIKTGGISGQKDVGDSGYTAVKPRGVRT